MNPINIISWNLEDKDKIVVFYVKDLEAPIDLDNVLDIQIFSTNELNDNKVSV